MSDDAQVVARRWFESIPPSVRLHCHERVTGYAFAAGPSFVAGKTWRGADSVEQALVDLVAYRTVLRAAHIDVANGLRLWFDWDGFARWERRDL